MGEIISISKGGIQGEGYLTKPKRATAPGVLIFHAWWGLNEFIRQFADRVSSEGFIVLAPDYYRGETASSIDQAQALKSTVDRSSLYALAKQALQYLLDDVSVQPKDIAAIGFSLGCGPALELVRSSPEALRAVVLFYGTGGGKFDASRADFLGHFAEDDRWGAHAEKVEALRNRLQKSRGSVQFYVYPQTQHWFFESDRPESYNQNAAEKAWDRTMRFLAHSFS